MATNKNSGVNSGDGLRSFLAIAAVFIILLTSCGIKASVKEFVGAQHTTKKEHFQKNNQSFLIAQSDDCGEEQAEEKFIVQNPELKLSSYPAHAVLLTTAIRVLFLLDPVSTDPPHPLYGDSSRIYIPIPIFIQHESLII